MACGAGEDSGLPLLEVEGLTKRFGGLTAVSHLDLTVDTGAIVGLIGPNGAGKTTVFNLLTGFFRPDAGRIRFAGTEIQGLPSHRICALGLVRTFQTLRPFPKMTVRQNVEVAALARRSPPEDVERVLGFLALASLSHRFPGELPIGHLKMLEVARALATRPRLLLLDEPYAGLNPVEVGRFGQILRQLRTEGLTVLLIEHVMKAVMSICDRVIVMHHGEKISEGSPAAVSADPAVIRAYLGGRRAAR